MSPDDTDPQAAALASIASALRALGTGNAATDMGAIEFLGAAIKEGCGDMADAIRQLAEAIDNLPARPPERTGN